MRWGSNCILLPVNVLLSQNHLFERLFFPTESTLASVFVLCPETLLNVFALVAF